MFREQRLKSLEDLSMEIKRGHKIPKLELTAPGAMEGDNEENIIPQFHNRTFDLTTIETSKILNMESVQADAEAVISMFARPGQPPDMMEDSNRRAKSMPPAPVATGVDQHNRQRTASAMEQHISASLARYRTPDPGDNIRKRSHPAASTGMVTSTPMVQPSNTTPPAAQPRGPVMSQNEINQTFNNALQAGQTPQAPTNMDNQQSVTVADVHQPPPEDTLQQSLQQQDQSKYLTPVADMPNRQPVRPAQAGDDQETTGAATAGATANANSSEVTNTPRKVVDQLKLQKLQALEAENMRLRARTSELETIEQSFQTKFNMSSEEILNADESVLTKVRNQLKEGIIPLDAVPEEEDEQEQELVDLAGESDDTSDTYSDPDMNQTMFAPPATGAALDMSAMMATATNKILSETAPVITNQTFPGRENNGLSQTQPPISTPQLTSRKPEQVTLQDDAVDPQKLQPAAPGPAPHPAAAPAQPPPPGPPSMLNMEQQKQMGATGPPPFAMNKKGVQFKVGDAVDAYIPKHKMTLPATVAIIAEDEVILTMDDLTIQKVPVESLTKVHESGDLGARRKTRVSSSSRSRSHTPSQARLATSRRKLVEGMNQTLAEGSISSIGGAPPWGAPVEKKDDGAKPEEEEYPSLPISEKTKKVVKAVYSNPGKTPGKGRGGASPMVKQNKQTPTAIIKGKK